MHRKVFHKITIIVLVLCFKLKRRFSVKTMYLKKKKMYTFTCSLYNNKRFDYDDTNERMF